MSWKQNLFCILIGLSVFITTLFAVYGMGVVLSMTTVHPQSPFGSENNAAHFQIDVASSCVKAVFWPVRAVQWTGELYHQFLMNQ